MPFNRLHALKRSQEDAEKPKQVYKDTKEELNVSHDYSNLQRVTMNSGLWNVIITGLLKRWTSVPPIRYLSQYAYLWAVTLNHI